MLSRHSSGIFWLARYVERAEFTAKLACASISAAPPDTEKSREFIVAALHAIGEYDKFVGIHATRPQINELEFLICGNGNTSSIFSCAEQARKNVAVSRSVLPPELDHAVLELLRTSKVLGMNFSAKESVESELLAIRSHAAKSHGIAHGCLLRGGAYEFWQTGRMIESISGIARSVDLGLNLARSFQNESSFAGEAFMLDYFANFAHVGDMFQKYGGKIDESEILQFFILDPLPPTSLAFAVLEIEECLQSLKKSAANDAKSACMAKEIAAYLRSMTTAAILEDEFNVFAREIIQSGARLADQIEFDFDFNS